MRPWLHDTLNESIVKRVPAALTTTSYAVLALLALRPWTTYQLAKQMERSLGWIWPRAVSRLYEEPKKLVAACARPPRLPAGGVAPFTASLPKAAGPWRHGSPSRAPGRCWNARRW